ncbi:MAG: LytTR family DNA-binding domain-containing protein [Sediminibacterium sp.]
MKLKILIVDDEHSGRVSLSILLKEHCIQSVETIKLASDLPTAITLLNTNSFDICFLDIHLSNGLGFDMVAHIPESTQIVYATAYSEYAINAIKNRAFDYLLKPVNPSELKLTVNNVCNKKEALQKVFVNIKSKGATNPIKQSDILLVKAKGPYSEIFLKNGRVITTAQTLKSLHEKLNTEFIRIHKSYIVRKDSITSFNKKEIFFDNNKTLPISRTGLKLLQEYYSS